MKFVALLSGGKDSILALLMAYRFHHEPVVIANIAPSLSLQSQDEHEVDSYMYQTVGHEAVEGIAVRGLHLPIRRAFIEKNRAIDQSMHYTEGEKEEDEVETLYRLLKAIKEEFPEVEGVTSGAILSNYQRHRVENVCYRLGLVSLAYLWHRSGPEVLDMANRLNVKAILVKTASGGLIPRLLLGKTLVEARSTLEVMEQRYGGHMAGEGGEFETFVLDCPLFLDARLTVGATKLVMVDDNEFSPSGHLRLEAVGFENKTEEEKQLAALICAQLRDGCIVFPSDLLPGLPQTGYPPVFLPSSPSPSSLTGVLAVCGDGKEKTIQQLLHVVPDVPSLSLLTAPRICAPHHSPSSPPLLPVFFLVSYVCEGVDMETFREEDAKQCWKEVDQRVSRALSDENGDNTKSDELVSPFEARKRCLHYFIDAPHPDVISLIDNIYRSSVSLTSPPGCTPLSSSSARNTSSIRFYVLVARYTGPGFPNISIDRVHNQSRSCWAAGKAGPYAQGWRLHFDEALIQAEESSCEEANSFLSFSSEVIVIGGLQGRVPATHKLAEKDADFHTPSNLLYPSSSSSCGVCTPSETADDPNHNAPSGILEKNDENQGKNCTCKIPLAEASEMYSSLSSWHRMKEMMSQFAYAFANAAQYGRDCFSKEPQHATLFTLIVSPIFVSEFTNEWGRHLKPKEVSVVTLEDTQNAMKNLFYRLFLWCSPDVFKKWMSCHEPAANDLDMPSFSSSTPSGNTTPLVEILLNASLEPSTALLEIFMRWD